MHQIIQYQKTGELSVAEVPAPMLKSGGIIVRNVCSLISAGTEKTSVTTAQASLVGKARSRPDLVRQVLDNARREGLQATYAKVRNRLDNYKELGYSSAGVVVESATARFRPGDRVACAGAGYAAHAEMIFVPQNLAVKLPEAVAFDEAAFTTVGAIALQGVRQAEVQLGENVVVIGLGLIGLLTVQLLRANGCRVFGLDVSPMNFEVARKSGCDVCAVSDADALQAVESFTRGYGADAVLLTAGTRSNQPLELALQMARKKGRVVIIGMVGMNLPRSPFYEKELDLRISCSYGPGRYDADYEEKGHDYPIGYVRWTENRNMEAFLDLLAAKRIDVCPLITHRFDVQQALAAYDIITGKRSERYLGILLEYPERNGIAEVARTIQIEPKKRRRATVDVAVGFIGAGNFAQANLLPHLVRAGVDLRGVVTSTPVNAKSVAEKFGFAFCSTDPNAVLQDERINTVFIASRHDTHARYVVEARKYGKHVFVEKPLAVNREELQEIEAAMTTANGTATTLFVGFNRRFSLPLRDIAGFFERRSEPLMMLYRVNAGFLPMSHWTMDPAQGGRIIGEMCHFVDSFAYLCGAAPREVFAQALVSENTRVENRDNVSVTVRYGDGSLGTLIYHANGSRHLAKEYLEVHCEGRSAVMDNFRQVVFHNSGKSHKQRYNGGKGHAEEIAHFLAILTKNTTSGLSIDSIFDTTRATFAIAESLRTGTSVSIR